MGVYPLVRFLHVLVVVIALGTSAGLGLLVELYGDDPAHGDFVLAMVRRVEVVVVIPGYLVVAATGLWLARDAGLLSLPWIQASIVLWLVGGALVMGYHRLLVRQMTLRARDGRTEAEHRLAVLARLVGGAAGIAVVVILFLMTVQPGLSWWPAL